MVLPSCPHSFFVSPEKATYRDYFRQRCWRRQRPDFLVWSITLSLQVQIIPNLVCMFLCSVRRHICFNETKFLVFYKNANFSLKSNFFNISDFFLFQTTFRYNLENKQKPDEVFKLSVSTPVTMETIDNNCRQRTVKVCAR